PWWPPAAHTLRDVGKPLLLGALHCAGGGSARAWLLCNGIWHWRVRNKRRRRLAAARRAAGA
ncbi:MAG: hypothetical protein ACK57J_01055, partial [Rubrivivax sp.]